MGLRMVFENSKTLVNQLGYDTSHAVVTQSYLRSDVYLSTTSASYQVPILVNQIVGGGTNSVRNQLLNLQDLFVVSSVQILLGKGTTSDGAAPFYTYNDAAAFPTGANALYALYNSSMSIISNNSQIVPAWDILKHYFAPQTQQGITQWDGGEATINQLDASMNAEYPVEPNFVINGAANYQIALNLPSAPNDLDEYTFVSFQFRGCLLQNCTSIK
jgi:hypothetical protein